MRENGTARSGVNTDRVLISGEHHTEKIDPSFIPSFLFFVMRPLVWSEPCVCVCVAVLSEASDDDLIQSIRDLRDRWFSWPQRSHSYLFKCSFLFKQAGWLWTRSYANQISAIFCFSNIYFLNLREMTNKYFPEFLGPQICRLGFLPLG